jgi:streptogramin lyase
MKPLKSQINLRVINNTALPQPVSILGVVANSNSANNSNILYEFNLTGQNFLTTTSVNINISNTSNPSIILYNAPVTTQSIQGVVDALNTLNQGIFSYSGSTIYVSSSYYIYSNISIAGTSVFGVGGSSPQGLVVNSSGNVYVTNSGANSVQQITPSGVSTIFGATGNVPIEIAIDSSGNIFTANNSSNNVTKITPLGVSTTLGTTDFQPLAITVDSAGNVYTANQGGSNITKITPLGVSTNYGNLSTSISNQVRGIVVDTSGNVFVVCTANNVVKVTPAGVSTNFGTFVPGNLLSSIAIDSLNNIYVADQTNQIIYKLTPSAVQTTYGTSSDSPRFITIDSSNNIYCLNQNRTVDKILATGGTTTLSNLTTFGGTNTGIALDSYNNIYVCNFITGQVYLIVQ